MTDGLEARLFAEVGREVRRRGHFLKSELVLIGRWRSHRAVGLLKTATERMVESVSAIALDANTPWEIRDQILCILDGVMEPMASALLTVWDSERYTFLDRRSVESFEKLLSNHRLEEPSGCLFPSGRKVRLPRYVPYVQFFAAVTDDLGVDFRTLDRALWKWHREGMPCDGQSLLRADRSPPRRTNSTTGRWAARVSIPAPWD